MFGVHARSQLLFPAVLVVTLALALMPTGWLGWLRDPAQILSIPLAPFTDVGNSLRTWLRRPPPEPDAPTTAREEALLAEARRFEQLYLTTQIELDELKKQLEQLEGVNLDEFAVAVDLRPAAIIGRDPTSVAGIVELNQGARHRVDLSTIAMYGGQHLIGRITDIDPGRSFLTPITNSSIGLIRARVFPKDRRDIPFESAPEIQLEPRDNGTLTAEIASEREINIGDVVKLTDRRWPQAAQARILGYVEAVEPKHDAPLRNLITVRPLYQANEIASVMLFIETERIAGEGS